MRILKHWANIGRTTLLLCCSCAVATAVVWKYRPSLVHEIDRTINWNYIEPWRDWHDPILLRRFAGRCNLGPVVSTQWISNG